MSPLDATDSSSSHWITQLGQAATALAAIIGLTFLVVDRLSKNKMEAEVRSATLSKPTLDRPVRLSAFLDSHNRLRTFTTRALREPGVDAATVRQLVQTRGVEINYILSLRGVVGTKVAVTPKLYTRTRRIPARTIPFTSTEYYTLEARRQTTSDSTWTPYPLRAGTYYVEVVVRLDRRPPHDDTLAVRRSALFRVFHNE